MIENDPNDVGSWNNRGKNMKTKWLIDLPPMTELEMITEIGNLILERKLTLEYGSSFFRVLLGPEILGYSRSIYPALLDAYANLRLKERKEHYDNNI